jgi:hypothetical protein
MENHLLSSSTHPWEANSRWDCSSLGELVCFSTSCLCSCAISVMLESRPGFYTKADRTVSLEFSISPSFGPFPYISTFAYRSISESFPLYGLKLSGCASSLVKLLHSQNWPDLTTGSGLWSDISRSCTTLRCQKCHLIGNFETQSGCIRLDELILKSRDR